MRATVFRIESSEESGVPCPSLAEAMRIAPSHRESFIATSRHGVHLADAFPVAGPGSMLRWRLTRAGQDVIDRSGWTAGAPVLSEEEYDALLAVAIGDDLERVAS